MMKATEQFLLSDEQLILLLQEDDRGGSQIEEIFGQLIERSPIISPIEIARILSTILGLDKKDADQIRAKLIGLVKENFGLPYSKEQINNGVCLYFDIDNTVYLTDKLKSEIIDILVLAFQQFGVQEERIKVAYADYYSQWGGNDFVPEQCVPRMAIILGLTLNNRQKNIIINMLYSIARDTRFIDPKAVLALNALSPKFNDTDNLAAFTQGHTPWQMAKLKALTLAMGLRRKSIQSLVSATDKTRDPVMLSRLAPDSCVLDDRVENLLKLAENKQGSALKMFWYNPANEPAPSEALAKARQLKLKVIEIHSIREMEEYLL